MLAAIRQMMPSPGVRLFALLQRFVGAIAFASVAMCGPQGSGESHAGTLVGALLGECSSDKACVGPSLPGTELQCECSVCTVACESVSNCERLAAFDDSTLNARLLAQLVCRPLPPACTAAMENPTGGETGICDVVCSTHDDCIIYGSGFSCVGGFCRYPEPAVVGSGTPPTCPDRTVRVPGKSDGTVQDLCFDVLEVSVADYASCVAEGACSATLQGNAYEDAHEDHPIDHVSIADASAYCAYVGKRVPTRTEWQWVAHNGSVYTIYPWGDAIPSSADDPSRVCALATNESCEVGSFPAGNNGSKVADLAGNVAEIVQEGLEFCVAGGAFDLTDADVANGRLQTTDCQPFSEARAEVGFRCVVTPE